MKLQASDTAGPRVELPRAEVLSREVGLCRFYHRVAFFHEREFHADRVARFLEAGLKRGAATLVAATATHLEQILGVLERLGVDVVAAQTSGAFASMDADAIAQRAAAEPSRRRRIYDELIRPVVLDALARHPRVRIYGEIVDRHCAAGHGELAVELEDWWEELLANRPAELLCGYSLDRFCSRDDVSLFHRICGQHHQVTPADESKPRDWGLVLAELEQTSLALEREGTRRREAEAEASRAKDEFLAMLGHELRNPLAPILTALQIMRLRDGAGFERERAIIERQARHMVRLVDDLLDASRITRGDVELERAPVELALVVASAIEAVTPLIDDRAHRLEIDLASRGLVVDADAERLARAFANLLANAARYTPEHGAISIAAARVDGQIVTRIRDNGIGIEPELKPRVFDLFVQGQQASHRPRGGLGLGLTIARRLVELHGGTLEAESAGAGLGSTIILTLPAHEAARSKRTPELGGRLRRWWPVNNYSS